MANYGFTGDTPVTSADILASAREWTGTHQTDPELRDAIKASGKIDPAFTAWCASFMNMTMEDVGLQGTKSNLAKSFLGIGTPLSTPQVGAIAVFNRTSNPTFGHVGIISRVNDDGTITVLGGNQSKSVKESTFSTANIAGYRDVGQRAYSALGDKTNTPGEIGAANRSREAMRDSFRGPTDFGVPVWDGTVDDTTLAAPVGRVDMAGLPDLAPAAPPAGSLVSAYDYVAPGPDLGFNLSSAVPSDPTSRPGSLVSAYDYTAPGPDLGFNLSSAMPTSDFTPSIGAYDFAGGFSPQNAAMNEATSYLGGIYAGSVPSGGQFAPDTSYAPGPDLGGNLSNALASDYAPAGAGWGRAADKDTSPSSYALGPNLGGNLSNALSSDVMGQDKGWSRAADKDVSPASYALGPDLGFNLSNALPSDTISRGVGWGRAADKDVSLASYALGPDLGFNLSNALPSDKPFSAPVSQPTTLPGYTLPDNVPAPDLSRPAAPMQAAPSRSAPSTAPTGFRASPTPAAPAIAPAVNVPTMGVREASPAPSQTYQDALSGFGSSKDFLGSLMSGNRGGLEALSGLTGTNYGGLAQMAMSGDQYAQPAMLGLERAYSNAMGLPGNLSLFGGGNSGARTDNLGPVVDQATGQVLGNYDPSDPKNQGLFGGLGGWLGGLFDGGGGGLGTTPGSGGLY